MNYKEGEQKTSADNPLDEKKDETLSVEKLYDAKDKDYLNFLQQRLESAKNARQQPSPYWSNKTYIQYYEENEKIANTTHIDPKKNADDVTVSAGTIEQKLDTLLSHINNLNLSPEVLAFDKDNNKIGELGVALEDIIHDTEIRDGGDGAGDEEKRLLRQRELLKQGTVFVQEEWIKKFEYKKGKIKNYNGEFKNFEIPEGTLEKVFEGPSRTLLYGPNVFLGDTTEFYMENQPYIFVVIQKNYDVAKERYGKFENWKYVTKGNVPASAVTDATRTIFDNKWRFNNLGKDEVEIIMYQDKRRDEFQIMINGVCMLPIGFPLSAVSARGEYNVSKQVFRVLNDKFAYGGSFVSSGSIKEISALVDEMLKLFVLKTRKSITPAYVNTSGRVIDKKVLSPGRISMGFDPNALQAIAGNEVQGVTAGEANFLEKMQSLIDKSTVSDQFAGQQSGVQQTATQTLELQRQARLTLGLTIAACTLLEKKCAILRLYNILDNWFEPVDSRVEGIEDARKMIQVYRRTNRDTSIPGEGPGQRSVIPQDGELPEAEVIRAMERQQEDQTGKPTRFIFLSPKELRNASLYWYIVINTKERESSPFFKALFKEMLGDMITLMSMGSVPNKEGLEEQFAQVWGKPRNKLFAATNMGPALAGVGGEGGLPAPKGRANASGVPSIPVGAQ